MQRSLLVLAAALAGLPVLGRAQDKPAPALAVAPMAGQRVAVLPTGFLSVASPADEYLPGDAVHQVRWADSVIASTIRGQAPEVDWVFPPELRRIARRTPGLVGDPDHMGQSLLRASFERVPDPLRANLRSLAAMTDGRMVLVPAGVAVSADSSGAMRAEVAFVLADTRSGSVVWRSYPVAVAATPAEALRAAVRRVLPGVD